MKKIILIVAFGILIRLFLSFSTFHSDVQPFYFAGSVIAKGNALGFYDYLGNLPQDDPVLKVYPTTLFNYPPLVYFSLGPVSYLMSLGVNSDVLKNFILDLPSLLGDIRLNTLLLLLKLPYLFFDLGIAALLYQLFDKEKNKILALTLWIFNPVNLYATYMLGQFDVIPTFIAVLALFFAVKKNRVFLSAFFLGLGAAYKIFPALFLIPLALLETDVVKRLKILGIGAATYIATILPFIGSTGFRGTALVAGQTTKSLYAAIPISGGESVMIFPLLITFFYLIYYFRKNLKEGLWAKFLSLLVLFFVLTHFHPQWFLWITPFLLIDYVKNRKHWPLALSLILIWIGQITFYDPGLSVWLFSPLSPQLYGMGSIWSLMGITVDINFARSILQTLFASVGVYYLYYHFPRKNAA